MDNVCPQTGDQVLDTFFERYPDMLQCETAVRAARNTLTAAFNDGHKLMVCGNGGSAADSEHIVGELL